MAADLLSPSPDDILLRGSFQTGFELLKAETFQPIVEGLHSLADAVNIARQHGAGALWQLNTDDRGRLLGAPLRLPLRS
jgi:hypothetical protein